jgi:hypothetical protein
VSYYGSGQPGGGPEQQPPGDPYQGGQGGYYEQALPSAPPDANYGQPPAGDGPGYQQPPPTGWPQPHQGQWQQPPATPRSGSSNAGAVLVGLFLVLLGVWFLFRDEIALDFGQLWPVVAVALGAVMVVAAFIPRRRR